MRFSWGHEVRRLIVQAAVLALVASLDAQKITLPGKDGSVRFAVIGDAGTGGSAQRGVAEQIAASHQVIISGSAAKLRRGNIGKSALTAKGYDEGYTFMLVEIAGDDLHFQAITNTGQTVDSGRIQRRGATSQP
jgi:hypothetical protein